MDNNKNCQIHCLAVSYSFFDELRREAVSNNANVITGNIL